MFKIHPGFIPSSGSTPEVNGFYSGPRPILHPSLMENPFSNPANKLTNKWTRVENITSLLELLKVRVRQQLRGE